MHRWTKSLAVLAVALTLVTTAAWAAEKTGRVQQVDPDQKRVVLDDGTELWVVQGMSLDLFIKGKNVKVMYDEKDGKKWVRSVEAMN